MRGSAYKLMRLLGALGLGGALALAPLPAAAQDSGLQLHITQVDTSHFPEVKVYLSATNASGEPAPINPNQIVLSEDGKPVKPSSIHGLGESEPLTTMLVMDVSGSMLRAGKLQAAKAAAQAYVNQMRPGDQAGLNVFNTQIRNVQPITSSREALLAAIDGLQADNDTAMYDALYQAIQTLNDVPGRKAIIVLTDGIDNRSTHTEAQVIQAIGPSGLSISIIGLGEPSQGRASLAGLDEPVLKSLASQAGGSYAYANDPNSLNDIYQRLGRALQSEYVLTYASSSPLRNGVSRALTVQVGNMAQASGNYNPGGVVPEVASAASWPTFFLLLAGLVLLLIGPGLIGRGLRAMGPRLEGVRRPGQPAKPRVKLHSENKPRIKLQ